MKKFLKVLLVVVLLLAGVVLGVGFGMDPTFEQRYTTVIDAPFAKVSALVSDPKRTAEWLPKEAADIESTEMVKTSVLTRVAGAAIDQAVGGGTNAGKNVPTHIYHLRDGKTLEMRTADDTSSKKYMERVVGGTSDISSMFKTITWGFEMEPADGNKTKITVVSVGECSKPMCNFVHHVMGWLHMDEKYSKNMTQSVETVAKK